MSGQATRTEPRELSDRVPLSIGLETAVEVLDDGTLILSVEGEIDLATSARFETELRAALALRVPAVILDLSRCGFLDCSALAALVRVDNARSDAGPRFSVVVPHRNVRVVFELTGFAGRFELHPTRAAAVRPHAELAL